MQENEQRLAKRDAFAKGTTQYDNMTDAAFAKNENSFWLRSSDAIGTEDLEMDAEAEAKAQLIEDEIMAGKLKHLNSDKLKDEKSAIELIFTTLDSDGDKCVSKEELQTFFPKNQNLFASMDYDKNGKISLAEMLYNVECMYQMNAKKAHGFTTYLTKTLKT